MSVELSSAFSRAGIIALTGATGFIGSRLTRRLCATGWPVRVLIRCPAKAQDLSGLPLQRIEGALEDQASLQRLVANVYAVIHCAGAVRGITATDFKRSNVDGLGRLVHAAASQRPPPRFLSLSSLAAREPALSPYAASKREGEQRLAAGANAMPWSVLRPPAVYGPGDRELAPLFRWMGRGIAPVLGSADARFSLLYVDDLAAAVLQWLEQPHYVQGIFELHDGRPGGYGWDEVAAIVAAVRARAVRRIPIPTTLLQLLASVNVGVARLAGYAPMFTPAKVRELSHPDWVCDNAALTCAIGWTPRVLLEEGLRLTLGWGNPVAA